MFLETPGSEPGNRLLFVQKITMLTNSFSCRIILKNPLWGLYAFDKLILTIIKVVVLLWNPGLTTLSTALITTAVFIRFAIEEFGKVIE